MNTFVNQDNYNQHFELLHEVYRYYPVGLPSFGEYYEGQKEARQIVEKKIDAVQNDLTSVSYQLEAELKNKFRSVEVENRNYYQFPNYYYVLKLQEENLNNLNRRVNCVVCISLLTNHYTCFFEDIVRFSDGNSNFSAYAVEGVEKLQIEGKNDILNKVSESIKLFFPGRKYTSHSILKNTFVQGVVPLGQSSHFLTEMKASLYELLFAENESINFQVVE